MTSFLDKLNGKLNAGKPRGGNVARLMERRLDVGGAPAASEPAHTEEELAESQKLDVDVYQTPTEVTIYAQAAGVDPSEFDITLDEENDVLTIRGTRRRPEVKMKSVGEVKELEGKFLQQECAWEPFYRKIVLPSEVDVVRAEAVYRKGLLVVTLPILKAAEGRKLQVVEMLSKEGPKA